MLNPQEVIERLKGVLLESDVELASVTTADGIVITAEELISGKIAYIEGEVAPVGEYLLEDKRILIVGEAGVIVEVKEAVVEEVPAEQTDETPATEIEASEEVEKPTETPAETEVETDTVELSLEDLRAEFDEKLANTEKSIVAILADFTDNIRKEIADKVSNVELSASETPQVEVPKVVTPNGKPNKFNKILERIS